MNSAPLPPLTRRQLLTLGMLFVGYVGYYFCRSNLSVLSSLLIQERPGSLNDERMGIIVSAGIFAYLVGKVTSGPLCDFLDGKRMFLGGMFLSILFTIGCGLTAGFVPLLTFWIFNRYAQSIGWGGLVKISSRWFPAARYGMVLGILSLSYQFGDSLAKFCLGSLLNLKMTSQSVFLASAGILAGVAVFTALILRASPKEIGEPEPEVHPLNVYGRAGEEGRPENFMALLRPLLSSPSFWLVCGMSAGLTFIRETLNFWTPRYLELALHLPKGDAAHYSAVMPLAGGLSAILAGFSSDRLLAGRRSILIALSLLLLTGVLLTLSQLAQTAGLTTQVALLSVALFLLVGPYSFLGGAMALDLGARRGSATTAGLIDAAGYAAGSTSGAIVGGLAGQLNWPAMFYLLAGASAFALAAAVIHHLVIERPRFAAMVPAATE